MKLLELKSRHDEHIVCAALSSDSRWLAYSTETLIRIYALKNVRFCVSVRLSIAYHSKIFTHLLISD